MTTTKEEKNNNNTNKQANEHNRNALNELYSEALANVRLKITLLAKLLY